MSSAVEAAPPPPRPPRPTVPPPSIGRNKSANDFKSGYSLDLEGVDFGDSGETNKRKRSMTLGSASRYQRTIAHASTSNAGEKKSREPHVIDSSGRGSKPNGRVAEDTGKSSPAKPERPPNRPPLPKMRSVSQPSTVANKIQPPQEEGVFKGVASEPSVLRRRLSAEDGVVKGEASDVPVMRRRLNSEGSVSSYKRLSRESRGSRETSPLPQLPEDSAATPPLATSPTSSSSSFFPPRPKNAALPPPVPRRTRASSTPPPSTLMAQSKSASDIISKSTSCSPTHGLEEDRGISFLASANSRTETGKEEEAGKDEDTPSDNPVVPPRPFLPPRPYPPNAKKKPPSSQRHPPGTRPASAPAKQKPMPQEMGADPPIPARPKRLPARPNKKSPKNASKVQHPSKSHDKSHDRSHDRSQGARSPPAGNNTTSSIEKTDKAQETASPLKTTPTSASPTPKSPQSPSSPSGHLSPKSPISPPPLSPADEASRHPSFSVTAPEEEEPRRDSVFAASPVSSPTLTNGSDGTSQGGGQVLMTQQSADEQGDTVNSLPKTTSPGSPAKKGRKIMDSMKKSFRSLRVKSKRSPGTNRRTVSESTEKGYPDPLPQGIIPPLVVQCVAYLNRESVLVEEGLFRVPGDLATIRKLREEFVNGRYVDLTEVLDPHTVAGLLKLYFREQKASLIPRGLPLSQLMTHVKNMDVESVTLEFEKMDVINVATLSVVIEVLAKIAAHSDMNLMTSGIIATSCGPSLFPYLPPSNANQMTKFFIDHYQSIFKTGFTPPTELPI